MGNMSVRPGHDRFLERFIRLKSDEKCRRGLTEPPAAQPDFMVRGIAIARDDPHSCADGVRISPVALQLELKPVSGKLIGEELGRLAVSREEQVVCDVRRRRESSRVRAFVGVDQGYEGEPVAHVERTA